MLHPRSFRQDRGSPLIFKDMTAQPRSRKLEEACSNSARQRTGSPASLKYCLVTRTCKVSAGCEFWLHKIQPAYRAKQTKKAPTFMRGSHWLLSTATVHVHVSCSDCSGSIRDSDLRLPIHRCNDCCAGWDWGFAIRTLFQG